ncbi:TetR/AcrR family transcriptional regulator [Brevundimonas aurifodinae]|uniref:TetR/AcrR family transcriptional regulator n=1 Tax=Brevundimonas aurifodinae TaxID=1508312 RepID=A0ABV1NL39_9CAUL
MRQSTGGVREARGRERREAFLTVAATVFRAKGLKVATMADVAAAVGVAKPVLYRRFPSKDALIAALTQQVYQAVQTAFDETPPDSGRVLESVLAAIRSVEDGYVALVRDGEVYLPDAPATTMQLKTSTARAVRRSLGLVGTPSADDPLPLRLAVETLTDFIHAAFVWWIQHGESDQDSRFLAWLNGLIDAWPATTAAAFRPD